MKVKKKRKRYMYQIALACLLICCVVQWIPDLVYADSSDLPSYDSDDFDGLLLSSESVKTDFTDGNGEHVNCEISASGSKKVYLIKYQDSYTFVSREPFSCTKHYTLDDGTTYSNSKDTSSIAKCDHYQFYTCPILIPGDELDCVYYHLPDWETLKKMQNSNPSKYDSIPFHFYGGLMNDIQCMKIYSVEGKRAPGSVNNPIEDADIGCLVISKKKSSDLSGLGDNGNSDNKENLFRVRFGWKYKTNTGFSLQKNKYAQTFIQVRIQNRSVVYKNLRHTEIKRKLNSYGENAIIYNSLPVDHQPLVVTLTDADFLKKYLPKYYAEINTPTNLTNALFLGNKYAFQFRVVCTDDLSVIPGNNTGAKWHCGRWTETSVDFDPVTPTDDKQKTGDIDDNGDFVQNEDDTTTKIDDASDKQYDSDDDASDDFNNSSENNKDGFSWDSFKSLINQCKEIPGLIKSIFSFLPDWVLVFVAVGLGIWIFVLIKRAIV